MNCETGGFVFIAVIGCFLIFPKFWGEEGGGDNLVVLLENKCSFSDADNVR